MWFIGKYESYPVQSELMGASVTTTAISVPKTSLKSEFALFQNSLPFFYVVQLQQLAKRWSIFVKLSSKDVLFA